MKRTIFNTTKVNVTTPDNQGVIKCVLPEGSRYLYLNFEKGELISLSVQYKSKRVSVDMEATL